MGYAFGEKSLYELRKSLEYAELKNFGGISPRVHPMIDTPTYGYYSAGLVLNFVLLIAPF